MVSAPCGAGEASSVLGAGIGVLVGGKDVDRGDGVGVRNSRDGGAPQLVRTKRKNSMK